MTRQHRSHFSVMAEWLSDLLSEGLRFKDVDLLRVQVLNYIRINEKEFEFIREFRGVSYQQEKDWQNFLSDQARNSLCRAFGNTLYSIFSWCRNSCNNRRSFGK